MYTLPPIDRSNQILNSPLVCVSWQQVVAGVFTLAAFYIFTTWNKQKQNKKQSKQLIKKNQKYKNLNNDYIKSAITYETDVIKKIFKQNIRKHKLIHMQNFNVLKHN